MVLLTLLSVTMAVAIESDPLPVPKGSQREHAVGLYNDGVLLMLQKHYAAAQQKFEAALALHGAFPEAHNNLGTLLALQGKLAEAISHFREVVRLSPSDYMGRSNLGLALLRVGKREEAAEQFREALRMRPREPAASTTGSATRSAGTRP